MKIKMLIATAAVAVSGIAATGAAGADKAPTEVTIKGQEGDYYGYVKSPDRQTDLKIGSDTAQPNGPDAM